MNGEKRRAPVRSGRFDKSEGGDSTWHGLLYRPQSEVSREGNQSTAGCISGETRARRQRKKKKGLNDDRWSNAEGRDVEIAASGFTHLITQLFGDEGITITLKLRCSDRA